MKNNKYKILSWSTVYTEKYTEQDNLIDWKYVKEMVGSAHIDWILEQPLTNCQMFLVKTDNESDLVVEFYKESTEVEYCLRWGK